MPTTSESTSAALTRLPRAPLRPLRAIGKRVLYALAIIAAMVLVVALDRDGYRDNFDPTGEVSLLDAVYYATVSLSTTGYGDVVPVTDTARLVNIVIITPLRIAFLGLLVGTALEVLTERTRQELRLARWRSRLRGHTVVVGYGTKGRSALAALCAAGRTREEFVIVDRRSENVAEANQDGLAAIQGDATRAGVLRAAGVDVAREIIVAPDRDDTAVLVTLTARELNPAAIIVAAVREAENEPLLLRGGATAVITSAEAAGRMMGFAAMSPSISRVFADLLVHGTGLEIAERPVHSDETGRSPADADDQVVAVVRNGKPVPFDRVDALAADDRLIVVRSRGPVVEHNGAKRP